MKGDFTRSTFDPKKHYSGVRMQQGRVQLDADWNEQVDIESYRDQTTTADVVGATGVPVLPDGTSSGFMIQLPGANPTEPTMTIRKGRIYVNGILCENDQDIYYVEQAGPPVKPGQPDYPNPPAPANGLNIVYLDVWERHITALEDPTIQEVALGGPDTATRTKIVWQVKYLPVSSTPGVTCKTDYPEWDALVAPSTGKLNVHTAPPSGGASGEPCIVPPTAGYRGLENQLYRVEIHRITQNVVDDYEITYKWSRDNGSFLFGVEQMNAGGTNPTVKVKSLGRDQHSGLRVNDWIEIRDRQQELAGTPGVLAKIIQIDTVDRILTLDFETGSLSGYNTATGQVTVRRWDFTGDAPPTFVISGNTPTGWIPLELGIEVEFSPNTTDLNGAFKVGDFWMFAARTSTQDVEWPKSGSTPIAQSPLGIKHHYCRLALASYAGGAWNRSSLKDCRPTFLSLADIPTLGFHFVGGDGQEGLRGAALPKPLQVAVTERGRRKAGELVRFTVKEGNGRVKTTRIINGVPTDFFDVSVIAETDIEGVASAEFTLDHVTNSQQVEAVLLDDMELPRNLNPIRFNASFNTSGTDFTYVGGDGQEGTFGGYLPQQIQVGVNDLGQSQPGAHVRFRVVGGSGTLRTKKLINGVLTTVTGSEVIALTGSDGVASCDWQLDASTRDQRVEARLLDNNDQLRNVTPIFFNATVAIDREFLYVGGDGQEAFPGGTLPAPLQVGVLDGEMKAQGVKVKFKITKGTGALQAPGVTSGSEVIVETGADGVAWCNWTLDSINTPQHVEANLLDASNKVLNYTPIRFTATHSVAKNVRYTPPSGCGKFTGMTTVQEALDALCACDCGPECPPVIRITGIFLGTEGSDLGHPIHPYTTVTPETLKTGIRVKTDTQVDSESIRSCTVYAEVYIPYPIGTAHRTEINITPAYNPSLPMAGQFIGFQPIVMPAIPSVDQTDNTVIKWVPNEDALTKLNAILVQFAREESLAIRFHLKGPSIWAEGDTRKVLAGHTKFTGNVPQFPSGDDCENGSDFIFCFNIVKNPPVEEPCEKITSVVFNQPIITGQDISGTLYLDRKTEPATTRVFKVVSDSNSVIPSNQIVVVPGDASQVSFTLDTSANLVTTTTPVKLNFVNNIADDPCQQSFATVVNVDPVPCDAIAKITLNDTIIGEDITGTVRYAKDQASAHTLTIVADNDRIPTGQNIAVPATSNGVATITIDTDATPTTPVTTLTPLMVRFTDPCGSVHQVPVNILPVPCIKIRRITINPCQGGSPAHVLIDFYEAIRADRTITFISPNEEIVETNSIQVAAGTTQAELYLTTYEVQQDVDLTLTVEDCGGVLHPTITVTKKPCEEIAFFEFDPNPIGGSPITGKIKLASTAVETRRITFNISSAHTSVIDQNQYIDITPAHGTSLVPFSLTSHEVVEPVDVVVTVIHCGRTYYQHVRVGQVPCEPPIELHFDKNPIIGGTLQTGYIQLKSASYSADTPLTIVCSDPAYLADRVVTVAAGAMQVPFSFTMPAVVAHREIAFKAVRPCGETEWVPVFVHPLSTDRPRINSVEIGSPTAPNHVFPFRYPDVAPGVNLAAFAQEGPDYMVRVMVEFCGPMPDPGTINNQTFQLFHLGETPSSQGEQVPAADIQFDVASKTMWCDIPSVLIQVGSYYRIVLKGTGPAPVLSAGGAALAGKFVRELNGTNCSGEDGASNFQAEFFTIWNPNML